ncbi:hypothetical protein [Komagataeibacter diospyri]|nr:hypothetical protein [Komagataeibacter diospyri]
MSHAVIGLVRFRVPGARLAHRAIPGRPQRPPVPVQGAGKNG